MSIEEKKAWSFLAVAVVAYGIYLVLVLTALATDEPAAANYAPLILWTVGGAILAGIVANIIIVSATPREGRQSDQRDTDIARLGEHVGQAFLVLGGVGALVLTLLQVDYFWIANALYLGFVLSAVVGSIARVVAYHRGVPTW